MTAKGTPAIHALAAQGVRHRLLEYDYDASADAIGIAAAQALGLDPALVFKTLVCQADGPSQRLIVAVIPVAARLNLKALAQAAGVKKVELAPPALAERSSGYVVGGISPLGQRRPLPTFLDQSAGTLPEIVVNGGRRGLQFVLAPDDLLRAIPAQWAALTA